MANFTFVRNATFIGTGSGGIELLYESGNSPGDTLIAVFAAVSASADFTAPAPTLTASNGNLYVLESFSINILSTVETTYGAIAIYVCRKVTETAYSSLQAPPQFITSDSVGIYAVGVELFSTFSQFEFDSVFYQATGGDTFSQDTTQAQADDICVSGIFDYEVFSNFVAGTLTASATGDTPATNSIATQTFTGIASNVANGSGVLNISETFGPQDIDGTIAGVPDIFGFALFMSATHAGGGSAAETLTFSINKGPDPLIPKEGRAIATVQIDCTQQQSHFFDLPIDYPEYAYYGDFSDNVVEGAVVIEFDLEHLFQGSGLSEVRSILVWARPNFMQYQETDTSPMNREDVPFGIVETNIYFAAMLTNTTTLQTVTLGSTYSEASLESGSAKALASYAVIQFPANKHSLKYRFICPQGDAGQLKGKYTVQFCNFEVVGSIVANESLIGATTLL